MLTTDLIQSKKLKELGAPTSPVFVWLSVFGKDGEGEELEHILHYGHDFSEYHTPYNITPAYTLQELIEWLGDEFAGLHSILGGTDSENPIIRWEADSWSENSAKGKTPLEAVYLLCCAVKSNPTGGEL